MTLARTLQLAVMADKHKRARMDFIDRSTVGG